MQENSLTKPGYISDRNVPELNFKYHLLEREPFTFHYWGFKKIQKVRGDFDG